MSSKENTLAVTSSSHFLHNIEQTSKGDYAKKRASSIVVESNVRNSQHQLRESINAVNFPYRVSFEECHGVDDVLIAPSYMEFKDGSEGNLMQQTLQIRNLGTKAAIVRVHKPNSMLFQLGTDSAKAHKLYPGLGLAIPVVYLFKQSSSLHAMIPIEINRTTLDYHLICTFSSPHLVVQPAALDFGYTDLNSQSQIKTVTILNDGGKTGRFSVDAGKHHHLINIRPDRGHVKPNQRIRLRVQVFGKYEGMFNGSFWIKSYPNICISVKVNIIKPKLLVEFPTEMNGSVLIDFPSTYLETRRYQGVTLKNISSEVTSFVVLSNDCNNFQSISEMDAMTNPSFDVFDISPAEGRLLPFEEVTLSVSFRPTFKKLQLLHKLQQDRSINHFVAVVKISKIQITEAKQVLKTDPKPSKKVEQNIPKICFPNQPSKEMAHITIFNHDVDEATDTILYLHGEVEIPYLQFQPEEIQLNDLNVDDRVEQSICIKNPSQTLSLKFTFVTQPWIRCQPCQAFLKPKQYIQVVVTIRAQFNLDAVFYLEFDVWASSVEDDDSNRSTNVVVCRLSLKCSYNPLKASPGDTSLRHICRVASLNKLPLEQDYSLTYTPSQLKLKWNHRDYWTHYFREIFSTRKNVGSCAVELNNSCSDYSFISDIHIRSDAHYCGNRLVVKPCEKRQRTLKSRILRSSENKTSSSLSPLQLFKVRVTPLKLDFGKMIKNSQSSRQLTFENNNNFEITICLMSLNESSLTFPDQRVVIVKPKSSAACNVQFHAEHFGKFSSYLNYTINNEHKYQLPLMANVVFKSLKINANEIVFETDCHPLEGYRLSFKHVEIENELNADTTFKWTLPENSNFRIEPQSGCVPAGKSLYVGVHYHELNAARSNRIEATFQDEDKACVNLRLEAVLRAPNVFFISDNTDCGQIPLNLAHYAHTVLYNAEYFEVFFEVDQRSLVKGIAISPTNGSIQPRGIVVLSVRLLFDACIECSTQIDIIVQKRLPLQWNVKFSVVFPKLKFEPSVVEWNRVCVNSYRVQRVLATNLTDVRVVIRFLLSSYDEFHVSSVDSKSCIPVTRGDSVFEIRAKSTITLYLHFVPCDLARYSLHLPLVINELLGPAAVDGCSNDDLRLTKFLKSDDNNDEYYYSNSNVKELSFLPIPAKLPTIYVNAIVTQPIVRFNKLSFHFTDAFRRDKWKCCNNSPQALTLVIYTKSCSQVDHFPFAICWMYGPKPVTDENGITAFLKPSEEVQFQITFNPTEPRYYAFELPINLNYLGNEQMYNQLILDGTHTKASIETDVLELNLSPVPLNIASKQRFNLRVSNFTETSFLRSEIRCPQKCSPVSECKLPSISFPCGNAIKPFCSHDVQVEIEFESAVPVSFCTSVVFFDECETSSVSVGISATADNSLLTTHAYRNTIYENFVLRKRQIERCAVDSDAVQAPQDETFSENIANSINKRETLHAELDFKKEFSCGKVSNASMDSVNPHVVVDTTITENKSSYLQAIIAAIEGWLYDEVLSYEFNPKLFDGMSLTVLNSKLLATISKNDKKKEYPKLCTYVDILLRLTNTDEVLQFERAISSESLVVEVLRVYEEILKFLLKKGAFVSHFSAEYLLTYTDYEVLAKNNPYLLHKDTFQFCSQRAWVDLLLQSYKVFAMTQVNEESLTDHARLLNHAKSIDSLPNTMYAIDVGGILKRSISLNYRIARDEALLLAWLEFNNALHFKSRSIKGFGECLGDGLAFIAVTINYCPYLRDFFTNLYRDPVDIDQKTHNAICLLLAWQKIRLGFTLTPTQIVHPNAIQMLMLSRYLFKHLPTYLIRSKVTLACPLTKSISTQIRLPINLTRPSSYVVQFIDNDINAFTSKAIVSIKPHKNQQIKVNFDAHKILETRAYLVLCGSSIGPFFAENLVFLLEGLPDELKVTESFLFSTKLYQIVKKNLTINVPYEYPEDYEIWISQERPNTIKELAITKWESTHSSKYTLNRLTFHDESISIEKDPRTANVTLSLCCLICESQSFWIVFRSKSADFIVQITSNYRISVTDNVQINATKEGCVCPNFPLCIDFECPFIYKILFPADNIQLHNCILKLFKNLLAEEDKLFWTTYLDNTVGLRFIKWFVKDSSCCTANGLFDSKHIYHVTTDKSSMLLRQDKVCDGSGSDQIELTIHIRGEVKDMKKTLITLTSWNKKEIRLCQVDIFSEESNAESIRSLPRK